MTIKNKQIKFLHFFGTRDQTHDLTLDRQALMSLSYISGSTCVLLFFFFSGTYIPFSGTQIILDSLGFVFVVFSVSVE